jgi:ElaB/YqjD/DUF883 family membrane-anchored ribosome-binding protein
LVLQLLGLPAQPLAFLAHPFKHGVLIRHLTFIAFLGDRQHRWEETAMTEALRQSSENPEFGGERTPSTPEKIHVVHGSSALEHRAAQAGSAMGRAAAAVRNIQERLTEGGKESPAQKFKVITGRGRTRAQEFRQAATARAQEWTELLRERGLDLKDRAQERWQRARVEARRVADERPIHVALGAGAVGFLLGVALRIRRAHHAER